MIPLAGRNCPQLNTGFPVNKYALVLRPLATCFRQRQRPAIRATSGGLCGRHCFLRRQRCQRGFSAAASSTSTEPKRSIFYRQLAEAAQLGDYAAAEECLNAIKAAGYDLTPHMYHGLIFCYAKAGVVEAAVRNFYLCLEDGLQPLPETYAVVIHACLEKYETSIVEEVYISLLSASVDRRPGWEAYLRGLVSMGLRTTYIDYDYQAQEKEARPQGWQDSDQEAAAQPPQEPDGVEPGGSEAFQGDPEEVDSMTASETAVDLDDDPEEEADSEVVEQQDDEFAAEEGQAIQEAEQGPAKERIVMGLEDLEDLGISVGETADKESAQGNPAEDEETPEELPGEEQATSQAASQADSAVEEEEDAEDGDDDAEKQNPILGADGYKLVLFTDKPLDLEAIDRVELDEAIVGGTAEDLKSPEAAAALEQINSATGTVNIEPIALEDIEFPENGQELKNALVQSQAVENPPMYHPGVPEGRQFLVAKITETMEYGRQEGWYVDVDTYENVLRLLCEDPEHAVLAQDILYADLLERPDVQPETRHFNCILRAESVYRGVRHARKTVEDMIEGKYGLGILPDIETMNAMLEGCVVQRLMGKAYAMEDFQEVIATIITGGMKMNKRSHALQLMMYLLDNDLDKTLWELAEMEALAAPHMALEELSDHWVAELIAYLIDNKCVLEALRLLLVMREDERELPDALKEPTDQGLSFFTLWLPNFYSSCHSDRNNSGLQKYQVEKNLVEYQGVLLDPDTNEAISSETGLPMRTADMSEDQVLAELELRDIPTTGSADQRLSRLQRARNNEPQKIQRFSHDELDEVGTKKSKKAQKQLEKEATLPYWIESMTVEMVNHKKASNLYMKTFLEEAKDIQDGADKAYFEHLTSLDLSPEITGLLKEYRSAVNTKDLERQYMLETRIFDTETPEFLAVNPHFYGREGFGFKRTWPNFGRGTRLAFYMMELAVASGCSATFLDLIQLLEGFILERDAEGCYELIVKMHPSSERLDPDDLALFYSKALTLCLECGEMAYVSEIGLLMEDLGLQPAGLLDDPEFLPGLRKITESVAQMTDYEKEVGSTLGEALEGAETYRMTDLEGKGEGFPETASEIYRQPRPIEDILQRLEIRSTEGEEAPEDEETDSGDSDAEDDEHDSSNIVARDISGSEELASDDEDDDFDFDEMGDALE